MLPKKHGAILFTGASASVKGYRQSTPFAMGKFALRGLAQSMARELSPQGIHVAHFVIDGGIRSAARTEPSDKPDSMLDPDAIALELLEHAAAAAQRLDLGARVAAVGREVLDIPPPCGEGRPSEAEAGVGIDLTQTLPDASFADAHDAPPSP